MQRLALAPGYEISRVIRGGWQLSDSHSQNVSSNPVSDMVAFADAGITTFDCADIYTGVEEMIGNFRAEYRKTHGDEALSRVRVHTKFVPDMARLREYLTTSSFCVAHNKTPIDGCSCGFFTSRSNASR